MVGFYVGHKIEQKKGGCFIMQVLKKAIVTFLSGAVLSGSIVPVMADEAGSAYDVAKEYYEAAKEATSGAISLTVANSEDDIVDLGITFSRSGDTYQLTSIDMDHADQSFSIIDPLRYVDGQVYFNLKNAVVTVDDEEGQVSSILEAMGITSDWLSIDLDSFKELSFVQAALEHSDELEADLDGSVDLIYNQCYLDEDGNARYDFTAESLKELRESITGDMQANQEKYGEIAKDIISKVDVDEIFANKYVAAVLDNFGGMLGDTDALKEQIKSALDEIDLSAITGSVEEDAEVPTAEEGTDVITIDDSSIPEDIQGYLSVKLNDSIGVGHLELSRENEEYPYINMDITFDTTVLEDALIEAPESATDVIDIIPNIAQFVTSLMQLGQEMETEDDFGELESIDWSGLESELESVDWSELESISIDDLAE